MLSALWCPMNTSQLWLFNIQTVDHVRVLSPILLVCCISRQHKDLALVNMANILHRAHFSADAAIVAHAALDLTSDLLTSHYTLGNIYAVSYSTISRCTEYNPGDNTLKRFHLFPSWFLMEYTQDRQPQTSSCTTSSSGFINNCSSIIPIEAPFYIMWSETVLASIKRTAGVQALTLEEHRSQFLGMSNDDKESRH